MSSAILLLNLLLTCGFGFGFGFGLMGLPNWGSDAILVFFSLDTWERALLFAGTLFVDKSFQEYRLFHSLRGGMANTTDSLLKFLLDGLDPLITTLTEFGLMFALTGSSIRFGVKSQAAFSLATQCLSLNTIYAIAGTVAFDSAQACKDTTSRNQLFKIAKSSVKISAAVVSPLAILFMLFPEKFATFYTNMQDPDVLQGVSAISVWIGLESILRGPVYQILFQSRAQQNGFLSASFFAMSCLLGLCVATIPAFNFHKENAGLALGLMSAMLLTSIPLAKIFSEGVDDVVHQRESMQNSLKQYAASAFSSGIFSIKRMMGINPSAAESTTAPSVAVAIAAPKYFAKIKLMPHSIFLILR